MALPSMQSLTPEVVAQATSGDAIALDRILTSLSRPFYNLALRMLQRHEDAEDATQECLIRVATKLSTYRGDSRFSTWAWSVATRCILDFRRGLARESRYSGAQFAADLADGLEARPSDDPEARALLAQVKLGCGRAMLQILDGDQRMAYCLCEILELDQAEAADALGTTHAALRKRLSRARALLRQVLQSNCGIVAAANSCRCAGRATRARQLERLQAKDAVELDVTRLSETVRSLDHLSQDAAYFRADPTANASKVLLPEVRRILRIG